MSPGRVAAAVPGWSHRAGAAAIRGNAAAVVPPCGSTAMGRRSGAIDPGVLLYLLQHKGMDAEAVSDLLYDQSGLLGVSRISDDMRTLLASNADGAKSAIDLFVYRISQELGAAAAALGGLDAK